MPVCPHCGVDIGGSPSGHHLCGDKYYREICPGRFQCMICGNIQDNTGFCGHCGMLLDCSHDHCVFCGCCADQCRCPSGKTHRPVPT